MERATSPSLEKIAFAPDFWSASASARYVERVMTRMRGFKARPWK